MALGRMRFSLLKGGAYNWSVKQSKAKTAKARTKKKAGTSKRAGSLPTRAAAGQNRAFGKAILLAKPYLLSPERLEQLLQQAARKTASLPRKPFRESWAYLHTMLRLLRAHQRGDYTTSPNALLSIIAAVAYLVDPLDLIPDEIPFLGFLDDATILEFAANKTRQSLDDFMSWELTQLFAR